MYKVEVWPDKYESRTYPFTKEDVELWLSQLPKDHTSGLTVIVCDASRLGQGPYPSAIYGHYLVSTERRIRSNKNPQATIKLFTLKVRYLQRGPIYTFMGHDYRWWVEKDRLQLRNRCRQVLRHEVGHYVNRRIEPTLPAGDESEIRAEAYAFDPKSFVIERG